MDRSQYSALVHPGSDADEKEHFLKDDRYSTEDAVFRSKPRPSLTARWKGVLVLLCTLLLASATTNALFLYRQYIRPQKTHDESRFAHLERNVPTEYAAVTDFTSTNRTAQDAAWDSDGMRPWETLLALDEDYAISKGLPHSMRWPWNADKGVYTMVGVHDLHCARALRTIINENYDQVPLDQQTWEYEHAIHCVNLLRESVMCNAEDTPLYHGRLHASKGDAHPQAGKGQVRMCRSWDAMVAWSREGERNACYNPHADASDTEREKYKYCLDGSRPWEKVEDT